MMSRNVRNRKGFTLIELIAVIVVLAILAGVALPKYFDYAASAKSAACKGTLGGVRAGIANYFANEAIAGSAFYPSLDDLNTAGNCMQEQLPDNPYDSTSDTATVFLATPAEAAARTVPTAAAVTEKGWAYDVTTGTFYAGTDTGTIGENDF